MCPAPRLLAALTLVACGCATCGPDAPRPSIHDFMPAVDLTPLVDPMVGTRGSGNAFPGALVPRGMAKVGPDTNGPSGTIDAYEWDDSKIQGFSHTHWEGPGGSGNGYSQLLVQPARAVATSEEGYASAYSHDTEEAHPGYYAVDLTDAQVRAELTATGRCGVHRWTFRGDAPALVLFDLAHSRGAWRGGDVEVAGDRTVRGAATWNVHPVVNMAVSSFERDTVTGLRTLHFHAEFDRAFDSFGTWSDAAQSPGVRTQATGRVGAWARWERPPASLELRLCLSSIDRDQAQRTLRSEVAGRSFDEVRAAAAAAWNALLDRVQVAGGTDAQRKRFYTALYHAFFQPADVTEDGRFWSGEDGVGAVLEAKDWRYYTDDWCLWDTFRTSHPLQTLLEPETRSDIVRSLLLGHERGGWVPKCTWQATGYSRVMIANPFVPVVADAVVKGFTGFDAGLAWRALYKSQTEDQVEALLPGLCGYFNQGTPPEYVERGWVGYECDRTQSVSMTLEHAFDDWAMARMAAATGRDAERRAFDARAGNWKHHLNPAHGFMQAKKRDGTWVEPFDPAAPDAFCEANSWIYTWSVPHDVRGLMQAMGGREAFLARLDEYFDGGRHDASNEPGFHVPWLYLYAGAPAKAQARVRALLESAFGDAPGGLPGNDDAGAMSAFYVWAALGLYPVTPGDGTLLVTSPLFDSAIVYLEPNHYAGRTFTIEAKNSSAANLYVQSAALNGAPLQRAWITFDEVVRGGRLELVMGPEPSQWGARPEDAPPSMTP